MKIYPESIVGVVWLAVHTGLERGAWQEGREKQKERAQKVIVDEAVCRASLTGYSSGTSHHGANSLVPGSSDRWTSHRAPLHHDLSLCSSPSSGQLFLTSWVDHVLPQPTFAIAIISCRGIICSSMIFAPSPRSPTRSEERMRHQPGTHHHT